MLKYLALYDFRVRAWMFFFIFTKFQILIHFDGDNDQSHIQACIFDSFWGIHVQTLTHCSNIDFNVQKNGRKVGQWTIFQKDISRKALESKIFTALIIYV